MSNDLIQIERPAVPALVEELAPIVTAAREFVVDSVEADREALERFKRCRVGRKKLAEHFKESIQKAFQAHRSLVASVNGLCDPIEAAERIYDLKSRQWQLAQKLEAENQSRRLQEQARREEEDRLLEEAMAAQDAGDPDQAQAILDQPVSAPTVTVAPAVAEVDGVSSRKLWTVEIDDVAAALRWLLDRPEWRAALQLFVPLLVKLFRPLAIAQRAALNIPGVRAVETESRAAR